MLPPSFHLVGFWRVAYVWHAWVIAAGVSPLLRIESGLQVHRKTTRQILRNLNRHRSVSRNINVGRSHKLLPAFARYWLDPNRHRVGTGPGEVAAWGGGGRSANVCCAGLTERRADQPEKQHRETEGKKLSHRFSFLVRFPLRDPIPSAGRNSSLEIAPPKFLAFVTKYEHSWEMRLIFAPFPRVATSQEKQTVRAMFRNRHINSLARRVSNLRYAMRAREL